MILTINGGSSSIKFALFDASEKLERKLEGKMDRIGLSGTTLAFHEPASNQRGSVAVNASGHQLAAAFLMDWLERHGRFDALTAIGHRIVHGMHHPAPEH